MLGNVTKGYTMTNTEKIGILEKAYLVGMTAIALTIIYASWGFDAPMGNFALVFGGALLGHTITEILNEKEEG
jgi:hypothetical protein